MKDTFYHLPEDRQQRLLEACIEEFGENGYDKSTTERIIQRVGISKGGLYEYIESKEDLYLYVLENSYDRLYNTIQKSVARMAGKLPVDIIERTRLVALVAVDFYVEYPEMVRVIARSMNIQNSRLKEKAEVVFLRHYGSVFNDVDESRLRFPRGKVLELMRWLLLKTREEFLGTLQDSGNISAAKKAYLEAWEFYLDALKGGIYNA